MNFKPILTATTVCLLAHTLHEKEQTPHVEKEQFSPIQNTAAVLVYGQINPYQNSNLSNYCEAELVTMLHS